MTEKQNKHTISVLLETIYMPKLSGDGKTYRSKEVNKPGLATGRTDSVRLKVPRTQGL